MVSADLLVIFSIADAEQFVYRLGAANFDMMLSGSLEEALRKQIRNMDHTDVLQLRGNKASDLLEVLNTKFAELGVVFSDCKVVDVELPRTLVENHSYAKEMEIMMKNADREHRFQMGEIERQAEISVRGVERSAEAAIVTENGKKRQAQLLMEQKVQKMEEQKRVQTITAEQNAKVKEMEAKAALERKKVEMDKVRVTLVSDQEGILSSTKVTADLGYDMELVQAEADKFKFVSDAEALKLEGNAEAEALRQLADKRKFELQIKEREILGKMATAGNFNLIGESGDLIIGGIINGRVGRVQAVD
jgi:regulator of protease activity HflC (stomatin/prohibitin superfamily)